MFNILYTRQFEKKKNLIADSAVQRVAIYFMHFTGPGNGGKHA